MKNGDCGYCQKKNTAIAKWLPQSGNYCISCNKSRLASRRKQLLGNKHPFNKKNASMSSNKMTSGNSSSIKMLVRKLDQIFSTFIRKREADDNDITTCVTCGRKDNWIYFHCGHYVSRGTFSIRFDERNCNVQCRVCNGTIDGEFKKHGDYIERKYGEGTIEQLHKLKNGSFKIDKLNLQKLINKYSK